MEASTHSERVGIRLKRVRERLGLSLRQVEERSRQLAERKQNADYFISPGWLNNIENGTFTPSACKQYSPGPSTIFIGPTSSRRSAATWATSTGIRRCLPLLRRN